MKQHKKIPKFKDIMDSSIEESIEESFANYGGANVLGSVQSSSKNKYSPATVLKAPPLRFRNPDISMGQSEFETKSPSPMIYPFEGIFVELVELFTRIESVHQILDGSKELATLTDAKKKLVSESADELMRIKNRLRVVIENIEEVTI